MKNNMSAKKEKKEKFEDDGRVIANMDFEHITGYKSSKHRENRKALKEARLSRKERFAIYKAALMQYMPIFGLFFASLLFVILFLYFFWIN